MRILVVEDEHGIADNIAEYLRQYSFAVDVAYDGNDGLHLAKANTYDIALLDWMLPGIDGLELCKLLRKDFPSLGIIMLTAKDAVDDRVSGLDTGADDYIVKPFALKELMARIQSLLRRSYRNQPEGNVLTVGDLTLDLSTQQATRGGQTIKLTRKLFQILELLMRNKDRVVSKAEIEAHIWDASAELWSDVVRSHMQKLREKVDKDFPKKLIQTVHGTGYRITDTDDVS
ncbi:MAG TPA: response regulator transcription factor [Candidatus Peribacteraceae bacterium]|nr:response regulator transcription factor [Candidatus Peribacteraceae bacterium]